MSTEIRPLSFKDRLHSVSRRSALRRFGAVAAGVALTSAAKDVSAQAAPSLVGHPLVGSWLITGPSGSPDAVNSFNSDGIAQTSGRSGFGQEQAGFLTSAAVGFGVWESTGDRTAAMTWIIPTRDDQNNALNIVFRGLIQVADDGQSFDSQVVLDVQNPEGVSFIMFPNVVKGRRIGIEAMPELGPVGTPVSG